VIDDRSPQSSGTDTILSVIYDCDNTIGIAGRDVDDALALLYLLGRVEVELLGVTITFGNDSTDETYRICSFLERGVSFRLSVI
jgi:inosine-uridine nucleoside N-ribohydrolase